MMLSCEVTRRDPEEIQNLELHSGKYADLHLHTNFSDSSLSVKDLVSNAKKAGLNCIAITDHDTVEAIAPALKISKDTLEIIPGIELTSEVDGREVHILGYFLDCQDAPFLKKVEHFREVRLERLYEMTRRLKDLGIHIDPEDVIGLSRGGSVGRLHLARVMVSKGVVSTTYEAFQKYIGDNCPAYVSKFKLTPKEAVSLILNVKGVPVLAHPHILSNQDLIEQLVKDGVMGIEVYYPEYTLQMSEYYKAIAKKYNLLMTGGSDCHGSARKEILIGKIKIPYEMVEKLKTAKHALG